jgi:hypothetical protein
MVLREPLPVGGLEVVEIHLAVIGRPILSTPHALEEHADGAPLLRLLALRPLVVGHAMSTAMEMPPARREEALRITPLDAALRLLSIRSPDRHETRRPAPTPVRRNRLETQLRLSSESCVRSAQDCADARSFVDVSLDHADPISAGTLTRDI